MRVENAKTNNSVNAKRHISYCRYSYIVFYVGVVYSGEYDVCDVTLNVYPHRASLKNMPGHGGNRTYDL